ncbi:MAG: chemotaxis protein CheW [Bacteroidales bacterium]|nr:chemotaxis protein CheW [Bacteroidales bacterium]
MQTENKQDSYLSFKIGEESFATNVSKVLEILELPKITKIPNAPDYMLGVINLRSKVLPVLDTRIKFGLQPGDVTVNTSIIVLNLVFEGESLTLGALVDAVDEVLELNTSDIEAVPSIGSGYRLDYLSGMVKSNEKFIMLLDVDKLFSTDEINSAQAISN